MIPTIKHNVVATSTGVYPACFASSELLYSAEKAFTLFPTIIDTTAKVPDLKKKNKIKLISK